MSRVRYYWPIAEKQEDALADYRKLCPTYKHPPLGVAERHRSYAQNGWKWMYVALDWRVFPSCCGLGTLSGFEIRESRGGPEEDRKEELASSRAELYAIYGLTCLRFENAECVVEQIKQDFVTFLGGARGILLADVLSFQLIDLVREMLRGDEKWNLKPLYPFTNPNSGSNVGLWIAEFKRNGWVDGIGMKDIGGE